MTVISDYWATTFIQQAVNIHNYLELKQYLVGGELHQILTKVFWNDILCVCVLVLYQNKRELQDEYDVKGTKATPRFLASLLLVISEACVAGFCICWKHGLHLMGL